MQLGVNCLRTSKNSDDPVFSHHRRSQCQLQCEHMGARACEYDAHRQMCHPHLRACTLRPVKNTDMKLKGTWSAGACQRNGHSSKPLGPLAAKPSPAPKKSATRAPLYAPIATSSPIASDSGNDLHLIFRDRRHRYFSSGNSEVVRTRPSILKDYTLLVRFRTTMRKQYGIIADIPVLNDNHIAVMTRPDRHGLNCIQPASLLSTGVGANDGAWHWVALVRKLHHDGALFSCYFDGIKHTARDNVEREDGRAAYHVSSIDLGATQDDTQFFNGDIHGLVLFDKALGGEELEGAASEYLPSDSGDNVPLQARQAKKEADAAAKNSAAAFKGFKQWKFGDPHPTHPTTPSPEVSRYHGFWRKKSTTHPTWVPFKMPNSLGKI